LITDDDDDDNNNNNAMTCMYWQRRGANRVLVGKIERRRPLGRTRCRWEKDIKIVLKK
jgi:hypothetical protein